MGRAAALLALLPQQAARDFIIKSMFSEEPDRRAALAAMSLWAAVSCMLVVLTIRTRTWFMMVAGEQCSWVEAL
jgi:NaMN:DMB phosphoribosyltransferase